MFHFLPHILLVALETSDHHAVFYIIYLCNLDCFVIDIARSPVFTHLSSTLNGLATLRVHQSQAIFQKIFDDLQDVHSSAWYLFLSSARWFGLWLDWICIAYITCVTYICVILRDSKYELLVLLTHQMVYFYIHIV